MFALQDTATKLLESYYKVLLRLVYRKTRSEQLAADLVNDAIVIFLEQIRAGKLAQLDDRLVGYIFRVSMNLLRNYRRHTANRSDNRAHPSELEACPTPNDRDQIDDERTRHLIAELLEPLTQPNQELIRRFYLEEEDKDTLSEDLGMSIPQLRLRLWRAKRQMKEVCTAKGWDSQDIL